MTQLNTRGAGRLFKPFRGGSCFEGGKGVRSAYRRAAPPDIVGIFLGFRVVKQRDAHGVLRGGSLYCPNKWIRSAFRLAYPPKLSFHTISFRLILDSTTTSTTTTQENKAMTDLSLEQIQNMLKTLTTAVENLENPNTANILPHLTLDAITHDIPGGKQVFLQLPKGEFLMGSPEDEPNRFESEGPQHLVKLENPPALATTCVTFDQYDAFCKATKTKLPGDNGWGRGQRPVINVSWFDAMMYCAWLSRETGKHFRLPSEAEWEYACRAGTTTPFSTGNTITSDQANYDANYTYNEGPKGEYRRQTVPVGSLPANPWGFFEMHGNVWEWCADVWHKDYVGAPTDGSAWL